MQTQGNSRASLLANLRTGGVRSVSGVPHSAGPTATSFQVPRFASQSAIYEDDEDLIGQMQHLNFNSNGAMGPRAMMNGPLTGGIAGPNQFQQQQIMMQMMLQQQQGMGMGLSAEQQALQLQLQNEILILQAKQQQQQQQFQAQILAQAQAQQAQIQAQIQAAQAAQQAQSGLNNTRLNPVINRRVSAANAVPSTAGPLQTSFNLGNPPARRTMSIDQESAAPMTAAIGGRFGARAPSLPPITTLNPNAAAFSFGARVGSPTKESHEAGAQSVSGSPPNPSTTVISGGTSLGAASVPTPTTSRGQADPSWRRPSQSSSPESQPQRLSPPVRDQSPISRARPQPLRFNSALSTTVEAPQSVPSSPEPDIVATGTDGVQTILIDNGHSTGSRSPSSNSPTTPVGGDPLPREEAAKRLYEGLGMGRPLPSSQSQLSSAMGSSASLSSLSGASTPARAVSQAVRQPRGPPTEVSELGPRNFASRVRSKAIGGLEAMMLARNRRQGLDVEAF